MGIVERSVIREEQRREREAAASRIKKKEPATETGAAIREAVSVQSSDQGSSKLLVDVPEQLEEIGAPEQLEEVQTSTTLTHSSRLGLQKKKSVVVTKEKKSVFRGKYSNPPRAAEFTLRLIPQKNREYLVGDLEEEYRTIMVPYYGPFWARVWYWLQTVQAVGFYVWPFIKRVLGAAAIGKLIGR